MCIFECVITGETHLREYDGVYPDGFRDYKLRHSDLSVCIPEDEECGIYELLGTDEERFYLDHAPETLGWDEITQTEVEDHLKKRDKEDDWVKLSKVSAIEPYKLLIDFTNGQQGIYDCSGFIGKGVFTGLENFELFKKVMVDSKGGCLVWFNRVDVCTDVVRAEIDILIENRLHTYEYKCWWADMDRKDPSGSSILREIFLYT
jgi:hypothetical protein